MILQYFVKKKYILYYFLLTPLSLRIYIKIIQKRHILCNIFLDIKICNNKQTRLKFKIIFRKKYNICFFLKDSVVFYYAI